MTGINFEQFKGKVEGKGYAAKSDGSMFYVVSHNGIKVEYKQGRGEAYTVGYGKPRAVTEALAAAVDGKFTVAARKPAGHFNLTGEGIDRYLELLKLVDSTSLPTATRSASTGERKAKVKGARLIKAKPVRLVDKPKVTDKTVEELADIKAKNLARLKAVGRKYAKGQVAAARYSDEPFDDSAVANLEAELDSFKAPAFLTKDEVKYLV